MEPVAKDPVINPALDEDIQGLTGNEFLQQLLPSLIGFAIIIAIVIFFFTALIGAIRWIASGGDKTAIESARGTLTSALIGIIITFSVFAIIQLIGTFFGIHILTIDILGLKIE